MKILVPGPPTGITTDGADLDFTPPNYDGEVGSVVTR